MGGLAYKMLLTYTLAFCLVTLETEASIASDCMRFLLDDEFHVHCATVGSSSTKPCLVATAEDHDYLKRYGIVSSPKTSRGQMICVPNGDGVDCVSTKFRSNNKINWMWTEWASLSGNLVTRTMSYTDNGVVKHCPYKETKPAPPRVMKYTIDNYGETYVDGKLIDNTARWANVKTSSIPANTKVIAFKVFNIGSNNPVGPRAWVSNGVITDATSDWKCSLVYEEGWNQVGFDDSHWGGVDVQHGGNAEVVGHGAVTVGCISMAVGPFYFRKTLV